MGNYLKKYREQKGITQSEFSRRVGISRQYLSDIETMKKQPTIKIAFDCARELDISVEELFYYFE